MIASKQSAKLFINDQHVGDVVISGWSGSWGIGRFRAGPGFTPFGGMFAEWSSLMHADAGPMSVTIADKLRKVKCRMYALKCRLLLSDCDWRALPIVNIDDTLIEWKEAWGDDPAEKAG